ncbi:MAG: recombinase family protein [Lachnospiraceae bacterium]|nr:recombinase family protein [Lachnospiraceae bacterium]
MKRKTDKSEDKAIVKAVIYCRVGRAENEKEALEVQKERLRAFAAEKGYTIVGEICDVGSGLSLERGGIKEVYALAHRHAMDKVIATDETRFCKDINKLGCYKGKLKKQHVDTETMAEPIVDMGIWKKVNKAINKANK